MGSTTLDMSEQTMFENTELGEYSGYVFLDKMKSGDTVIVRLYVKDVETSEYKKYIDEEYSDVLSCPTLRITPIIGKVGYKITIQQTDGTSFIVTHMWFKR
jgi:hypothetical protein